MWYNNYGNEGDVVLSSRVRLARNIKGLPFPLAASGKQQAEVIDRCTDALTNIEGDTERHQSIKEMNLKYIDLSNMKDYEKQAISECHLISPQTVSYTHLQPRY